MSCDDFHCISGICLLCREKEMGHLQGVLDTEVRENERKKRRERSRCLPETCALPNSPRPSTPPPPNLLQETEKMSLNLGCSISASQLPGSHWWGWTRAGAPVASGQREDFGVFMVEGVHLGKAVRWWDCTWWINASSVWSHFLRLTNRKTPQPTPHPLKRGGEKKGWFSDKKYVRESPCCRAVQNV